jgi:sugar lactone lactonase YvrE
MNFVKILSLLCISITACSACKKEQNSSAIQNPVPASKVALVAGSATVSGISDHANPLDARFQRLGKITWDHRNNSLYILDAASTSHLRKLDQAGITTIANAAFGVFNEGYDICLAPDGAGYLYVTTSMGQLMKVNTTVPLNAGNPSILIDWIRADGSQKADGNAIGSLDDAAISGPHGLAAVPGGKLYFSNSHYLTIHQVDFSETGNEVSFFAGKPTTGVSAPAFPFADGAGITATFGGINDMVSDNLGNVYVADHEYGTVRKISPDGTVSTYLTPTPNTHTYYDDLDGTLSTARAGSVKHVGVKQDGSVIFFATPRTLRAIIPSRNSVVTIAKFNDTINGIAVTPDGKEVYVACNYGIYKVTDMPL